MLANVYFRVSVRLLQITLMKYLTSVRIRALTELVQRDQQESNKLGYSVAADMKEQQAEVWNGETIY